MENYKILRVLGVGSSGVALLCESLEEVSSLVVIKQIVLHSNDHKRIISEVNIMKKLTEFNHPNICKLMKYFVHVNEEKNNLVLCLVLDYYSAGDLNQYLKKQRKLNNKCLAESHVIHLFVQICLGMLHLHNHKILHRDIKPSNIFLSSDNRIKLGDFGISCYLSPDNNNLAATRIGTPVFLSPEICRGELYSSPTDIWQLGCVLYELLTFSHPFNGKTLSSLVKTITQGKYKPISPDNTGYSTGLIAIITDCLHLTPSSRPTIEEILLTPILRGRTTHYLTRQQMKQEFTSAALDKISSSTPPQLPIKLRKAEKKQSTIDSNNRNNNILCSADKKERMHGPPDINQLLIALDDQPSVELLEKFKAYLESKLDLESQLLPMYNEIKSNPSTSENKYIKHELYGHYRLLKKLLHYEAMLSKQINL
jgi:NIMA (never in mitosis gene a)-related kinase